MTEVRALAVIPARMDSSRLPGKPLLILAGRSIVQWVHDAVVDSGAFQEVVVATDDERIANVVESFGGRYVMTSSIHSSGSERVAEAMTRLDEDFDVVANVQGDQPFVSSADLRALLGPYVAGLRPDMTTVCAPLPEKLADDPNTVKVVTDIAGRALYFSRSRIPGDPGGAGSRSPLKQHIGLYAFRADFLPVFARLSPTPLEQFERLEQLRALEHGYEILVRETLESSIEVNTPEDYERASQHAERRVGS